jgi:hypothetical protein
MSNPSSTSWTSNHLKLLLLVCRIFFTDFLPSNRIHRSCRVFARYRKKSPIFRPFWKNFQIVQMDKILRQPSGNDQCGFYVMYYMHLFTGDDFTAVNEQVWQYVEPSKFMLIRILFNLANIFLICFAERQDRNFRASPKYYSSASRATSRIHPRRNCQWKRGVQLAQRLKTCEIFL